MQMRQVYRSWRDRFGYIEDNLEKRAIRRLSRTVPSEIWSEKDFLNKAKQEQIIAFGDDALMTNHASKWMAMMRAMGSAKAVFVTNRLLGKQASSWLEKQLHEDLLHFVRNQSMRLITCDGEELRKKALQFRGKSKVFVWTGSLRVAAGGWEDVCNISFQDQDFLPKRSTKKTSSGLFRIGPQSFLMPDSFCLASVDMRRISEGHRDRVIAWPDLYREFDGALGRLCEIFEIKRYTKVKTLLSPFDPQSYKKLDTLRENRKLTRFCRERFLLGESAVVPQEKIVILSSQRLSDVVEEAAHYLRTHARAHFRFGIESSTLEEAFAFFASLMFSPLRKFPSLPVRATIWDRIHHRGYRLGAKIHRLWKKSPGSKKRIVGLWNAGYQNEFEAAQILDYIEHL